MPFKNEKEEATIYRSKSDPEVFMTIESLVTLAVKGFATCEKDSLATGAYCASRKESGDDACRCVRNTFPSQDYYDLYLKLRQYYLQNVGKGLLVKIAGEAIGEKNE